MAKKNILFVAVGSPLKTQSETLLNTLRAFDRKKYTCTLLGPDHKYLKALAKITGLPWSIHTHHSTLNLIARYQLKKWIRAAQFSAIYLYGAHNYCHYIGVTAQSLGVPVILHLNDSADSRTVRALAHLVKKTDGRIIIVSEVTAVPQT